MTEHELTICRELAGHVRTLDHHMTELRKKTARLPRAQSLWSEDAFLFISACQDLASRNPFAGFMSPHGQQESSP